MEWSPVFTMFLFTRLPFPVCSCLVERGAPARIEILAKGVEDDNESFQNFRSENNMSKVQVILAFLFQ